ncbi:outer membrane protein [Polluticoccus soli]|uniref:outer membrane protein n=1 Tax=Polluticoccus soli TaxID=3034150 RepID=UPI0023E1765D|nr:hypothetical protein [Flavipsychrobacter sp. JY13-12]
MLQANLHIPAKRFTFYAGATGGYMVATVKRKVHYENWPSEYGEVYSLGGFLAGPQAGIAYNILPRISLSADLSARFVNLEDSTPPFGGTRSITYYSHMNYYTFGIGARYRF